MSLMMLGWMPSVGSSRISSFGPAAQRARDRELLLLAAREVAAAPVQHLLEHREQLEQFGGDAACRPRLYARPMRRFSCTVRRPKDLAALRHVAHALAHARSYGVSFVDGLAVELDACRVFTGTRPIRLLSSVVLPTPLRRAPP